MPVLSRRTALKGLSLVAGASALAGCATPSAVPAPIPPGDTAGALAGLDAWIRAGLGELRQANLSVAVFDTDRVSWSAGYGLADPVHGRLATARTRYRAGSVSKVFTAMAAMQLSEQGRLDLDAPLGEVLPGFRMRSRDAAGVARVTPRLILGHRAGLPTDVLQGMWSDTPEPFTRLVEVLGDEALAFAPGQLYAYSNVGFTLLGAAIEHLTATPFARWMQDHLLAPLGMGDSSFEAAPPAGPDAAIALDERGQTGWEPGLRDVPAGGLNTTVLDLLQLARCWFASGQQDGRRLLTPASLAEMQRPAPAPTPLDLARVGLGWHLLDEELDGVGPLLWHAGGTPHHHAELMLLPQLRLAVAVMSSAQAAGALAHRTALQALTRLAQARTGIDPVRPALQGADPSFPPALPADAPGLYDTPVGLARLERDGDASSVTVAGKRLRLTRRADGYFRLQYRLLGLIPVPLGSMGELAFTRADGPDGQAWLLARRKGRFTRVGLRLEPVPIPPAWAARAGTYRYVGGDAFLGPKLGAVRLFVADGLLQVEVQTSSDATILALAPVSDTDAVVRGLGRGRGDTVRARQDGATVVLVCSGLRFERQEGA